MSDYKDDEIPDENDEKIPPDDSAPDSEEQGDPAEFSLDALPDNLDLSNYDVEIEPGIENNENIGISPETEEAERGDQGDDEVDPTLEGTDETEEETAGPLPDPFAAPDGEENGNPEVFDTLAKDGEEFKSYDPDEKKPPQEIIRSKPNQLNKQLLLYIIGGVMVSLLIFVTFIAPLINFDLKKPIKDKKPSAAQNGNAPDYYSMVQRPGQGEYAEYGYGLDSSYETIADEDYDDLDDLPPVIDERYQNQNNAASQQSNSGLGGGSVYTRSDTRNDKLQAKSIAGIKGITPTQRQYQGGMVPTLAYPTVPGGNDNPYAQFGMPPKEDYANQLLAQRTAQYGALDGGTASSYSQQNDQSGKMAFYNQGRENAGNGYWLHPLSIWQGTIFEALLLSNINTDLPGECVAMISKNIYSSQDGHYLLIPQNSRLIGSYNSSISYSQSRVQVGWHTLIRPDGYYVNLGNMQGTDTKGAVGLPGFINDHPFEYLKAIALLSAMNIVNTEIGYSIADTNNQYVQNVMANTQQMANVLGGKLIDRALDVQPTITIRSGTAINIVANTNLVLPAMESYPVHYPYQRGQ